MTAAEIMQELDMTQYKDRCATLALTLALTAALALTPARRHHAKG